MKVRKIGLVLVILAILLLGASAIGESYAENQYSGKLLRITDDIGIVIGKVDVQLWRGRIRLSDITIPDTLAVGASAEVGSIDVSGVQWISLIRDRKVLIKDVSVNDLIASGDLSMVLGDSAETDAQRHLSLKVNRLDLEFDEAMSPSVRAVDVQDIGYQTGGNYNYEVRRVRATKVGETIFIDSLIMKPRYPKFEFGYRNGRRMGSIDLVVPEILIHDFDQERLSRDSVIDIGSIDFVAGDVHIFTDKRLPVDMERYVAMPHETLLKASRKILIDSVNVKDLNLRYETINPNTMNQGYIEFNHSYLVLTNVTNTPSAISENHVMNLDLYSKFMGVADLNAHFSFLLNRSDYEFRWNGTLESMEISEIDKFTLPVANMNIVEGKCESIEFQVTADIDSSHGTIDFSYEDLKVMAVDPETHRYRKLISGVANLFFIKESNLKGSEDYRVGKIAYEHETNRGLEHYVWTSLERGLAFTILPDGMAHQVEAKDQRDKNGSTEQLRRRKKKR